jgi:hypothetical protein
MDTFSLDMAIGIMAVGALLALGGRYRAIPYVLSSRSSIEGMSKRLTEWGVITVDTDAELQSTLARQAQLLMARLAIGMGLGIAIASGIVAALAAAVTNQPDSLDMATSFDGLFAAFLIESFFIGVLFGLVGGYSSITRRAAALGPRDSAQSPRSRHSVLDYYSIALWLATLVFYGVIAIVESVAATESGPIMFSALGATHRWSGAAVGATEATVTLAVPIIALVGAHWIAHSPGPAVEVDPIRSALFASFLRAKGIALLLGFPLMFGFSILLLVKLNFPNDAHVGLSGAINSIVDEAPFGLIIGVYDLLYIASMVFVTIGAATSRMGGRLTGWWWQPWPERREQTAAEGG